MWRKPVGEGAKRVTICGMGTLGGFKALNLEQGHFSVGLEGIQRLAIRRGVASTFVLGADGGSPKAMIRRTALFWQQLNLFKSLGAKICAQFLSQCNSQVGRAFVQILALHRTLIL